MTEVIGVRFRGGCKEYYFDPHGITVEPNQFVIVETAQGFEYAQCVSGNHEVEDDSVVQPLRPLVRVATENDDRTYAYNKTREKNAFEVCQKKIAERGLDMKLVRVESNFDGSKIIFFFTSDGRVDFRELVRDLAGVFRARIELRQIGVRDEAKMLGGLGICGRPFCCSQFLDDFVPVSIKMAKTQNLSLNPTKISGTCGRLMCCLKYEQEAYEESIDKVTEDFYWEYDHSSLSFGAAVVPEATEENERLFDASSACEYNLKGKAGQDAVLAQAALLHYNGDAAGTLQCWFVGGSLAGVAYSGGYDNGYYSLKERNPFLADGGFRAYESWTGMPTSFRTGRGEFSAEGIYSVGQDAKGRRWNPPRKR